MLIAEEFVLLALNPDGTPATYQPGYATGVTGALVTELVQEGHVTLEGGRVGLTGTVPTDSLLRQVLENVAKLDGKKLKSRLGSIRHSGWNEVVDGMIDAGVLGRHRPSPLQPTRHPVSDPVAHAALLARVRSAATGDDPLAPRDATLLALAGPCQLLEVLAPDRADRKHAKRRIADATVQVPAAAAVKYVIGATTAAIVAASSTG